MSAAPLRVMFYLATGGAVVTSGVALLGHTVHPVVTGVYLLGYTGLIGLGVAAPQSQIFGDVVTRVAEGVALTFDDGPDPEHTPRVLDALDARGAKGTFFMIARKMERHPDLVRDVLARGHTLGAHSYSHDRLYALRSSAWLARDADREEAVWRDVVGKLPGLFRPPIGLTNPRIARLADDRDRIIVGWTARPRDGLARTTPEQVVARVVPKLHRGAIVMLHDAAEAGTRTPAAVAALPAILDAAAQLGLSARTIPEP